MFANCPTPVPATICILIPTYAALNAWSVAAIVICVVLPLCAALLAVT